MELLAAVALAFVFAAVVAIVALYIVDVREVVWKRALPETRAEFTPKVNLRKHTPRGWSEFEPAKSVPYTPIAQRAAERGKIWEEDELYKAIISGLPLGLDQEHAVTLEIYRRVFLMVIEPMQKEWADAQEAEQAEVGWFTEPRGSGS